MRRMYLFLFAFCLAACAAEPPVTQAERAWAKAVTTSDLAALDKLLAPDLIYAHSTGVVESKAEYLGKLKSGETRYTAIDHESFQVKPYGDAAVVHSTVRMRGRNKSGPFDNRLMMLHLWVKQNGEWRLAAHQTTRLEK